MVRTGMPADAPPWESLDLASPEAFPVALAWLLEVFPLRELPAWKGLLRDQGPMDMRVFKVHTARSTEGKLQKFTRSSTLTLTLAHRCHLLWVLHRALSRGDTLEEGEVLAVTKAGVAVRGRGRRVGGDGARCVPFDARRLGWGTTYEDGVFSVARTAGKRSKWRLKVTFRFPNTTAKYMQSVGKILCYLRHGPPPGDEGPSDQADALYAMHICEHACCVNPLHMQWASKWKDIEGWRSLLGGPRLRRAFLDTMRGWGWL